MMSVLEYANDVNIKVEEILKKCVELNINVKQEDDLLDDEQITLLDNSLEDITGDLEELELIEEKTLKNQTPSLKKMVKKKEPQKNMQK